MALAGELVATLARDNGWAGVVIHGCVRDAARFQVSTWDQSHRLVAARIRESGTRARSTSL